VKKIESLKWQTSSKSEASVSSEQIAPGHPVAKPSLPGFLAAGRPESAEPAVELGALADRVLQKRKSETPTGARPLPAAGTTTPASAPSPKRVTLPPSLSLPIPTAPPVLPTPANAPSKPMPVFRLGGLAKPRKALLSAEVIMPAQHEPTYVPKPVTQQTPATREPLAPEAQRTSTPPGFVFDAFEQTAAAPDSDGDSDAGLTQRIDQILREQARRQGVDLT
jgi:hypothetical protein